MQKMNFSHHHTTAFFLGGYYDFVFSVCCELVVCRGVGSGGWVPVYYSGEGGGFSLRLQLLHLPVAASGNHLDMTYGSATAYSKTSGPRGRKENEGMITTL